MSRERILRAMSNTSDPLQRAKLERMLERATPKPLEATERIKGTTGSKGPLKITPLHKCAIDPNEVKRLVIELEADSTVMVGKGKDRTRVNVYGLKTDLERLLPKETPEPVGPVVRKPVLKLEQYCSLQDVES